MPIRSARRWRACSRCYPPRGAAVDGAVLTLASASALLQLRRVGISGSARTQDPPDHHAENENPRDVDEVGGCWHQVREPFEMSDCRRSTSRCTLVRRRPTDTTYPKRTTQTKA